ncbi:MAG: tetratricopeptide repeat protein [Phototrophicaceae bacterium]
MATTTLRDYQEKIAELLINGNTEEVIRHCTHILTIFPKNAIIYRYLGDALVNSRRWEEAIQVFRRVLTAYPDDYASHRNLAVVYTNLNQTDSAIWHYERAYESNNNDPTLVRNLLGLYQSRKKFEGSRLPITAGTAARQFKRNGLYNQAIDTILKVLKRSPRRVDLLLLLSQTYWEANRPVDAARTAIEVLKALPFCYEANKILAQLWLSQGRPSDASRYLSNMEQIAPYDALELIQNAPAPDHAVTLEEFNYQSMVQKASTSATLDWVGDFDESDAKDISISKPIFDKSEINSLKRSPAKTVNLTEAVNVEDTYVMSGVQPLGMTDFDDIPSEPASIPDTLPLNEGDDQADPMAWLTDQGFELVQGSSRAEQVASDDEEFVYSTDQNPDAWLDSNLLKTNNDPLDLLYAEDGTGITGLLSQPRKPAQVATVDLSLNQTDDDPMAWMNTPTGTGFTGLLGDRADNAPVPMEEDEYADLSASQAKRFTELDDPMAWMNTPGSGFTGLLGDRATSTPPATMDEGDAFDFDSIRNDVMNDHDETINTDALYTTVDDPLAWLQQTNSGVTGLLGQSAPLDQAQPTYQDESAEETFAESFDEDDFSDLSATQAKRFEDATDPMGWLQGTRTLEGKETQQFSFSSDTNPSRPNLYDFEEAGYTNRHADLTATQANRFVEVEDPLAWLSDSTNPRNEFDFGLPDTPAQSSPASVRATGWLQRAVTEEPSDSMDWLIAEPEISHNSTSNNPLDLPEWVRNRDKARSTSEVADSFGIVDDDSVSEDANEWLASAIEQTDPSAILLERDFTTQDELEQVWSDDSQAVRPQGLDDVFASLGYAPVPEPLADVSVDTPEEDFTWLNELQAEEIQRTANRMLDTGKLVWGQTEEDSFNPSEAAALIAAGEIPEWLAQAALTDTDQLTSTNEMSAFIERASEFGMVEMGDELEEASTDPSPLFDSFTKAQLSTSQHESPSPEEDSMLDWLNGYAQAPDDSESSEVESPYPNDFFGDANPDQSWQLAQEAQPDEAVASGSFTDWLNQDALPEEYRQEESTTPDWVLNIANSVEPDPLFNWQASSPSLPNMEREGNLDIDEITEVFDTLPDIQETSTNQIVISPTLETRRNTGYTPITPPIQPLRNDEFDASEYLPDLDESYMFEEHDPTPVAPVSNYVDNLPIGGLLSLDPATTHPDSEWLDFSFTPVASTQYAAPREFINEAENTLLSFPEEAMNMDIGQLQGADFSAQSAPMPLQRIPDWLTYDEDDVTLSEPIVPFAEPAPYPVPVPMPTPVARVDQPVATPPPAESFSFAQASLPEEEIMVDEPFAFGFGTTQLTDELPDQRDADDTFSAFGFAMPQQEYPTEGEPVADESFAFGFGTTQLTDELPDQPDADDTFSAFGFAMPQQTTSLEEEPAVDSFGFATHESDDAQSDEDLFGFLYEAEPDHDQVTNEQDALDWDALPLDGRLPADDLLSEDDQLSALDEVTTLYVDETPELEPIADVPDWLNAMVPGLDFNINEADNAPIETAFIELEQPTPVVNINESQAQSHPYDFQWLVDIVEEETVAVEQPKRRPRFIFSRPPLWLRRQQPTNTPNDEAPLQDVATEGSTSEPSWLSEVFDDDKQA